MAPNVIVVPKWIIILRGIQILLAVIILGISAYGTYWIHFNSWAFAIFTSLVTILIVLYNILTTHTAALKTAYNQWAILGADCVGVIFWLSAMASLAATRATFVIPTTINECVNDGSGGVCDRRIRRDLHLNNVQKREFVATYGYLNLMSAAAGLAAVEMLLITSTLLIFTIHLQRQKHSHPPSPLPSSYNIQNTATNGNKPQELNQISSTSAQKYEPVQQQQYFYSSQEYAPQAYQQQQQPEPYVSQTRW
ncbi:hypothetical protein LSUB1_G007870 [Lachnellula subtilissima]|uniref:MARVEL domain-containing protein n=1 Tax=Lachnellula subtilissima TaxID=602034 RepID=A0A8H8RC61_9HELO|nr:hypothetical protein LSUB1_G007870 [Lachnellula subtilissima]